MGWLKLVTGQSRSRNDDAGTQEERSPEARASSHDSPPIPIEASSIVNALLGLNNAADPSLFELGPRGATNLKRLLIKGQLDLSFVDYDKPLSLKCCEFVEQINLSQSKLRALDLSGSRFPGIYADGARIDGDLELGVVESSRLIDFRNAEIRGDFVASGASLRGDGDVVLSMVGAEIKGSLIIAPRGTQRFNSVGMIRLIGVKIHGGFVALGASLDGKGNLALLLDEAKLHSAMLLTTSDHDRFECVGGLSMIHVELGSDFIATGALVDGAGKEAICADSCTISGSVDLSGTSEHRFEAKGEVRFIGATIKGQFKAWGGRFDGGSGHALHLQEAKVSETVFLCELGGAGFEAIGNVVLNAATLRTELDIGGGRFGGRLEVRDCSVGVLRDDEDSWPKGRTVLSGFKYERFKNPDTDNSESRLEWIKSQPGFSWFGPGLLPQPFYQLARTFARSGKRRDAENVLFELERLKHWAQVTVVTVIPLVFLMWALVEWFAFGDALGAVSWFVAILVLDLADFAVSKTFNRRANWWGSRLFFWVLAWFERWFAGYGYRPFRAIGWLFALLLSSMLIFDLAHTRGVIITVPEKVAQMPGGFGNLRTSNSETPLSGYPMFDSRVYALNVLLPAVDLGQTSYWQPIAGRSGTNCAGNGSSSAGMRSGVCPTDSMKSLSSHWLFKEKLPSFFLAEHWRDDLRVWLERKFDEGLAVWWMWFEMLFGGVLAIIAIAAFTGLLTRREEV